VSKPWLAVVDSQIIHLRGDKHLPADLNTRFANICTLDLEFWDPWPDESLAFAIGLLNLPQLQCLLNLNSLDFMDDLTSRTSGEDVAKVGNSLVSF